ncbi:hypothetical protein MetMK1DRAFT_00005880 [Metallosphaera yellowstonensis MK1]|uniref:MCM C-terminal domain-containing protein n=1 Tax=Metallosphaera yellowstonensis MK1 TaxID=671065 RepID=H2C1G5_9CREN|nr:hypothetical protein [Metallosphaera yellowstonensis]EHP70086.1 hypothetical protein MetMK1DRAFT_00005880 [Metallosphaera yellowstonensis MK1]
MSEAKRAVEAKEGVRIDDKKITQLLENLVDVSFLVNENDMYRPSDVIMEKVFQ